MQGARFLQETPHFQAWQSQGEPSGAKLYTQQLLGGIKPPGEDKLMNYHGAPAPVGQGGMLLSQHG